MDGILALDQQLTLWINQHHAPVLDVVFTVVSRLGDAGVAWFAAALVMLIVGPRRTRLLAVIFVVGILVTELLVMPGLRELWLRPRPFVYLPEVRTLGPRWNYPSFPSAHGHLWGQATLLFAVACPRWRWPLIVMLLLTLYSRPYVGNHHVLDALTGALVGFVIGGLELAVAARLGLLRREGACAPSTDQPADSVAEQEC